MAMSFSPWAEEAGFDDKLIHGSTVSHYDRHRLGSLHAAV
jgi:hypothetical protein